jgi:predicted metal-dependent enzyme (double-stranded beta helix superfamily)
MNDSAYTLQEFVDDLHRLRRQDADEQHVLAAVAPLAQRLAASRTWLEPRHYETDAAQGFGAHLLHEERDHSLAVFAASWLPARGTPPHDHGTWAIVVGVDGPESNVFWKRMDDGSAPGHAELRRTGERLLQPGDVLAMPTGTIHSVRNESAQVTVSLHVYGRHINFTQRSQFDPERRTHTPFIVKTAPAH